MNHPIKQETLPEKEVVALKEPVAVSKPPDQELKEAKLPPKLQSPQG